MSIGQRSDESINISTASFTEWQHVVSRSFVPLEVRSPSPQHFHANLRGRVLDGVFFSEITVSEHLVTRTTELIRSSDQMYYKLTLQLEGTASLVQDGREALLHPGDIGLYDTSRPYTLGFDRPMRAIVVMFPHGLLDLDVEAVGSLTALALSGQDGLGRLVSNFLNEMVRTLDTVDGVTKLRLVHSTIDMVSTLLSSELIRLSGGSQTRSGELLHAIHDYVSAHLHDPALSPQSIADANHISLRYLQQIFQKQGTPISQWIRNRRMAHIRRDLSDPALANRTIAQIASAWGLMNQAHFCKRFKAETGETASGFRARTLAAQDWRAADLATA